MDLKQIKDLMAAMDKASIKKLRIKDKNDFELELEKKDENFGFVHSHMPSFPAVDIHNRFHPHQLISAKNAVEDKGDDKSEKKYINSPMVGTLYHARGPGLPPLVKVGDVVEEDTIVCIVEAMKVMNEVKAGMKGTISSVLIKNASPIEYGTHLFEITP